uniref:Uncharacterized protein n=1 Tax=Arundo donax TaxID=35708 RepID=A0A0A8YIA1_ARUDO
MHYVMVETHLQYKLCKRTTCSTRLGINHLKKS